VTVVVGVPVAVVHVVDVVLVRHGDVAAALAMAVLVAGVLGVRRCAHDLFSSGVRFGGVAHRVARDVRDMVVDEFVDAFAAPYRGPDQSGRAQDPQVLRDQGLGHELLMRHIPDANTCAYAHVLANPA